MRRILTTTASAIAGLAMVGSLTVATELPASAASGCDITLSTYQTVRTGSGGSKAKAAQCLLRSAGYQVRTDGSFSSADASKVRSFQRSHRIKPSGVVGSRTWTALLSRGSRPTLSVGDNGASVRRLQRSLTASVRKVPVTGYYGPITKAAVSSLQRSQGWRATGTVTPRVWRTLQAGRLVTVSLPKVSTLSASSGSSRGARALAFAKRQIGDRYRYGATGPSSWDCSGLTGGAWKAAGVKIPRTSQAQFRFGKRISKSNLRPGDLVFFYSGISHVGIYAGNGNVLHASRPSKPIGYLKMKYMPYQGARRPG